MSDSEVTNCDSISDSDGNTVNATELRSAAIDELLERMLGDDHFKDVEITCGDGVIVKAHASVLCAGSDAVRGILTNGSVSKGMRSLSWEENDSSVVNFFLCALYTGYAAPADGQKEDGEEDQSQPLQAAACLQLLLGSLLLAKKYQFLRLFDQLSFSVKGRLSADTFNEICSFAIKNDLQSLRTHCSLFAASGTSKQGPWFPGKYKIIGGGDGVAITIEHDTESADLGMVAQGEEVDVVKVVGQRGFIRSPFVGWVSIISRGGHRLMEYKAAAIIKERFNSEQLAPEVCYDLMGLWPECRQTPKKRRKLL